MYGSEEPLETALKTLDKIRSDRKGCGVILLDQYFAVPQIGEVVRDVVALQGF